MAPVIASGIVTGLLIALGVVLGAAVGTLLVMLVRSPGPAEHRAREELVAREAARRAIDEALRGLTPHR